jgi:capsid protein
VNYEPAERTKSELYKDLLPLLNSQAVDLLDNERLVSQLVSLERRTTRGGRDSIDHLPGAHDDLANAVAGALVTVFSDWATQKQGERERISPLPSRTEMREEDSSGSCLGNGQLSHAHR